MDTKSKIQKKKPTNNIKEQPEKEKVILLEKTIQELKDQLLLAGAESDAKDELLAKQIKVAKEAVAGWQKAESEISALKQQLKNLAHQKSEIEQMIAKLREERDEISAETKNKLSVQEEKIKDLEEKLIEINDKVCVLTIENKSLHGILDTKETIIKEMNESSDKASLTEMKVRLDATEKENSNLKYELHMAQKELEIRNKERDYNIKTAEAAYKHQMESLKKVSKLETECNKLRMMLRKRLPGPGAITRMRNEINNGTGPRRKMSSPLTEKLHVIEEENRVLKETLARKNEDTMSCVTESWATTIMSELEHFKEEKLEGSYSDFGFEEDQFQNYPGWLKDIVRVIIKKHYVMQMSVKCIIEEVLVALKKTGFYTEEEKDVKECTDAPKFIEIPDKSSEAPERDDLCETGEKSFQKENYKTAPKNVEVTNKPSEEVESQGSNDPDMEANEATNGENNVTEKECDKEIEGRILERDDNLIIEKETIEENEFNGPDDLKMDSFKDEKKSLEHEPEPKLECEDTKDEKEQLENEPDTAEGSKKLAECQEEMQSISKQLQAMSKQRNNSISDQKEDFIPNLKSDQRSCSLLQILAEENKQEENSNEAEKLEEASVAEQENETDLIVKGSEIEVPVQLSVPKKQKEGGGLLSRIFGRKRKEIKPEK